MPDADLICLVEAIVASQPVQALWHIKDRGMPVFAHTIDVATLALSLFNDWRERRPNLSLRAITVASLLHDLDKLASRGTGMVSHSQTMSTDPSRALITAIDVLQSAQWHVNVHLDHEDIDHIWHIVVSHHGRWGKIQPRTTEAALVHHCDFLSATRHRMAPIDASDILPLLNEGLRMAEIASRLEVTVNVVRDRLREACRAENVSDPATLLQRWRERGYVVLGTLERMRQLEETRGVVEEAKSAPSGLIQCLRSL